MARPAWQYLLLFLVHLSLGLAACKSQSHISTLQADPLPAPTTFCKCACFSNSTIIPLDGSNTSPTSTAASNSSTSFYRTCNDCNKQFCLGLDLSICPEATEDDVFTTCFQRDSTKDEAVVFIFIIATVGLLVWAAVKPWVLRWREQRRMGLYAPVSSGGRAGEGQ
jgi:hypothetical protein